MVTSIWYDAVFISPPCRLIKLSFSCVQYFGLLAIRHFARVKSPFSPSPLSLSITLAVSPSLHSFTTHMLASCGLPSHVQHVDCRILQVLIGVYSQSVVHAVPHYSPMRHGLFLLIYYYDSVHPRSWLDVVILAKIPEIM